MANYIFGPQIIGLFFVLFGIIKYFFPTTDINSPFGFKTPSSRNNQQMWDVANRYGANFCIKAGLILLVAGLAISFLLDCTIMAAKSKQTFLSILFMGSGVFIGPVLIVAIEKHLDKTFKR